MKVHTVGVSISKGHLDVYWAPEGRSDRFPNDAAGFEALIGEIDRQVACVAYVPVKSFHLEFEQALQSTGVPLTRLHLPKSRNFVHRLGRWARIGTVDARGLAKMARAYWARQRSLKELQEARDRLIEERALHRVRDRDLDHGLLKRQNEEILQQIERHLPAVEKRIHQIVEEEGTLARRVEILTSIPGVSSITAASLIAGLPELGTLDSKAATSLAGMAPVKQRSGLRRGRRSGRLRVRRLWYLSALSMIRCNPDMRRMYGALRARGKPPRVALGAVLRKLIILANVLLRKDCLWLPSPDSEVAGRREAFDEMRGESAEWDLVRISQEVEQVLEENYGELWIMSRPES